MKKSGRIIIIVGLALITLIMYRAYRANTLKADAVLGKDLVDKLVVKSDFQVKKGDTSNSNDTYYKMSVKKLDGFTVTNVSPYNDIQEGADTMYSKTYTLEEEKNKNGLRTSYTFGSYPFYTTLFSNDKEEYDHNVGKYQYSEIMKKYDINTILDLVNYIKENGNKNNNIFYNSGKLKENYVLYKFSKTIMPNKIESLSKVAGDYNGIVFNMKDVKEIHLFGKNRDYVFTFYNLEYFTDEKIQDFIGSLKYED